MPLIMRQVLLPFLARSVSVVVISVYAPARLRALD